MNNTLNQRDTPRTSNITVLFWTMTMKSALRRLLTFWKEQISGKGRIYKMAPRMKQTYGTLWKQLILLQKGSWQALGPISFPRTPDFPQRGPNWIPYNARLHYKPLQKLWILVQKWSPPPSPPPRYVEINPPPRINKILLSGAISRGLFTTRVIARRSGFLHKVLEFQKFGKIQRSRNPEIQYFPSLRKGIAVQTV